HRAALAAAGAALAAEELLHHPADIRALGDGVAIPTLVARDVVGDAQVGAHAHRDRLLSDVAVHRSANAAVLTRLSRGLVESADKVHRAIHGQHLLGRHAAS